MSGSIDIMQVITDILNSVNIAIINYPGALQSAVFGLSEMFSLVNQLCVEQELPIRFDIDIIKLEQLESTENTYTAVLLPPGLENHFYLNPTENLKKWLIAKHIDGSILCSACAGSFIIASTGL